MAIRFRGRATPAGVLEGLLLFAVLGVTGWFFISQGDRLTEIVFPPKPCAEPIRYSIAAIDPRFDVSTSTLLERAETASALWNGAAGKTVFAYDPNGPLKISLVYDHRQAANDELEALGYSITNDRESFDALNATYESAKASYASKQAAFDARADAYERKVIVYNERVEALNERGGAVPGQFDRLKAEKADLDADAERLRASQDALNAEVDTINAMGDVLRRQAEALNLKIDQTNDVNASLGKEYEEGLYTFDERGTRITVYSFSSTEDLHALLAHEFGHALGLDHVDDPEAIMYYLNRSQRQLSQTDIDAVLSLCSGSVSGR